MLALPTSNLYQNQTKHYGRISDAGTDPAQRRRKESDLPAHQAVGAGGPGVHSPTHQLRQHLHPRRHHRTGEGSDRSHRQRNGTGKLGQDRRTGHFYPLPRTAPAGRRTARPARKRRQGIPRQRRQHLSAQHQLPRRQGTHPADRTKMPPEQVGMESTPLLAPLYCRTTPAAGSGLPENPSHAAGKGLLCPDRPAAQCCRQ